MRIIGGKLSGLRIKTMVPQGVRPTADNVRESIFNMLSTRLDFDGMQILDVCAGTGAMGFEAISRGAENVVFIEKNPIVAGYIRNSAEILKIHKDSYQIMNLSAMIALNNLGIGKGKQFDLIFFDPPYESDIYAPVLKIICDNKILNSDGIIVVESASKYSIISPCEWQIIAEKQYGSKKVTLLAEINF